MSKTTAISIIVIALILITGGLVWWYLNLTKTNTSMEGELEENPSGFNFFPFGNTGNSSPTGGENGEGKGVSSETGGEAPSIREISSSPVSGFTIITDSLGGNSVRYVEQETGNVYEVPLEVVSKKRISNTTIPKTRSTLWLPGGNSFIARYLGENDETESFGATINMAEASSTGEGSVGGKFLPKNIFDISLVPSKDAGGKAAARIFYLVENADGSSSGFISDSSGEKSGRVFSSPFKEWVSFPVNENTLLLQTKPSGEVGGHLFSFSTKTGALQKTLGPALGLSVLPDKNGTRIIYSAITGLRRPQLYLYDSKSGVSSAISLGTFAEKCAWGGGGEKIFCAVPEFFIENAVLPDDWYKGKIFFADSLWEISLSSLQTRKLVSLTEKSVFVDADQISVSENNKYVVLRSKTNGSLWAMTIQAD